MIVPEPGTSRSQVARTALPRKPEAPVSSSFASASRTATLWGMGVLMGQGGRGPVRAGPYPLAAVCVIGRTSLSEPDRSGARPTTARS